MATRTIASPGVQINEIDLSVIARPAGETNVFMTGFTPQGPTDEIISIGSVTEFEDVFGQPSNPAERYLYHSARQVLNNNGNLLVSRLPYGSEDGVGFSNNYSATVYPVETQISTLVADLSTYNGTIALSSGRPVFLGTYTTEYSKYYVSSSNTVSACHQNTLVNVVTSFNYSTSAVSYDDSEFLGIKTPYSVLLTQAQYQSVLEGGIDWQESPEYDPTLVDSNNWNDDDVWSEDKTINEPISSFDDLKKSGIVVINTAKTTLNDLFEGYYLAISDNSNINPSTDFDSIGSVKAFNRIVDNDYQLESTVPESRFSFKVTALSGSYGTGSMSEALENLPTQFDFSGEDYTDSLVFGLFKIRSSIYNKDTVTLDYNLAEGYSGSLYQRRTQNDPNGGKPKTFFIEDVINNNSANVRVMVNPYLAKSGKWLNANGKPSKTVRVSNPAKNAYSIGVYNSESNKDSKKIGDIPKKLQRVLRNLEINDDIGVDIITEAGLGTIWTGAKARQEKYSTEDVFDDTYPVNIDVLYTNDNSIVGGVREDYLSIANQFVSFAQQTRKDHIFLADGLRYIYVTGKDYKITKRRDFIFSNNVYWPLKNLFAGVESSYAAVYGNWLKTNDAASDTQVWVPPSGFVAGNMVASDRSNFQWSAPAGFNRGTLAGVTDIGVVTTQKQRDLLYKISVNPIAFFPADGFVVYGQKTLYKKPSAFDRINVRRLFLYLEKSTQSVLKFFLFEPNSISTRTRLVGAITPVFDQAKVNDGIYNYQIICDERNNTPDIIDNNELKVSIYIQPVRTAEFILADFIATRTGVDFQEIIG
jgi:hypothetical protein